MTLVFGQDHPAGKWSRRHTMPATAIAVAKGHQLHIDRDEEIIALDAKASKSGLEKGTVEVHAVDVNEEMGGNVQSTVDIAVNESLTIESASKLLASPLTWLPALAYLTTFGLELIVDAQMANVLFALFGKQIKGFDQTKAGYYTSILYVKDLPFSVRPRLIIFVTFRSGLINLVTRPSGGFFGDLIYRKYGTNGKKFLTLFCGLAMGAGFLAGGIYLQNNHAAPHAPHRK